MSRKKDGRSKKHHTIPRFLLRNFVNDQGDLFEFDLEFFRSGSKKPEQVAHTTDFYTVDLDGEPSDDIEKILASLEDRAAKVVHKIRNHGAALSLHEVDSLVMLVALQVQRSTSKRDSMLEFLDEVEDKARKIAEGSGLDPDKATEKLRSELGLARSRNFMNPYMLNSLKGVFRLMRRRGWTIARRGEGAPPFILSDNPVVITDLREETGPPYTPLIPYGEDSKITMPLSADVALVSYFDPELKESYVDQKCTELVNRQQLCNTTKRVYASTPDFAWLDEDLATMTWPDLVKILQSAGSE